MEERRNATKLYNPMTVSEMELKFPSIPWREYLTTLLPKEIELKPDEVIIVAVPSFITKLEAILQQTPKR